MNKEDNGNIYPYNHHLVPIMTYMKTRSEFEDVNFDLTFDWFSHQFDKGVRNFFGVEIDDHGNLLNDDQEPEKGFLKKVKRFIETFNEFNDEQKHEMELEIMLDKLGIKTNKKSKSMNSRERKKDKIERMKKSKNVKDYIPKYVETMFENWEQILEHSDNRFEYDLEKNVKITCLGLEIKLTNPKTKKPFSIIISDDLLDGNEIVERLNYGHKVGGDLTKVGEWLDERKKTDNN